MLNILSKVFDSNQKEISRLQKIVNIINGKEDHYKKLTDKELLQSSLALKKEAVEGKDLDQLLPDVFALVREASRRKLEKRHFDVQLIAAIALHEGKIAEQKTGEGKTLSAVPALFLNSLTGKGVHLVTVNDYLAKRDCGWNGPIYSALGATCSVIVHEAAFIYDTDYIDPTHTDERLAHLRPVSRKEAYEADITYGTNNEFGFDYLRDNRAWTIEQQVQRSHYFAIVDEVDSILIDEARTPLIISQPAQEPTKKYYEFAKIIDSLSSDDYVIDEKQRTSHLTEQGIIKIEKLLNTQNLYEKDFSVLHHIEQALKARTLFVKDRDYVVRDGEVIIVDEFTGRLMPGRRYSEGLHQAIEAKEGVDIQQESQTLATISFQNYFRMYEKLSGMTGTAATEAEEFHKIYKLDVIIVPTNKPMIRADLPDVIFKTQSAKYEAIAKKIEELHQKGQPVLVGTTSIEKNEILSSILKKKRISHAVLNAKNHEKEAEIIAQAGQKGAVTVATNMAGRGVDIQLGDAVNKLGGLFILGTERHESRRIDNQLRGRSGRQGDPGASQFFLALDDDLMRIFGGDQVIKIMDFLKIPEDMPIEHSMVSKAIEGAQVKVEGHNFDIRKTTVEYDDVMNQQRQVIYKIRKQVLEAASSIKDPHNPGLKDNILIKVREEIERIISNYSIEGIDLQKIINEFIGIIPLDPSSLKDLTNHLQSLSMVDQLTDQLDQIAKSLYEERESKLGSDVIRQMEVFAYLNTIDTLWVEHLDTMDDLRAGIGLRGFAQRDPLIEYKKEGFELFEKLIKTIDYQIVHQIYKLNVEQPSIIPQPVTEIERYPVLETGVKIEGEEIKQEEKGIPLTKILDKEGATTKVTIERNNQIISKQVLDSRGSLQKTKIGRNDPCWCGSGKKYKKCHYPN